jgi:hypothetical protein
MLSVAVLTQNGTDGDALDDSFYVLRAGKSKPLLTKYPDTEVFSFCPGGETMENGALGRRGNKAVRLSRTDESASSSHSIPVVVAESYEGDPHPFLPKTMPKSFKLRNNMRIFEIISIGELRMVRTGLHWSRGSRGLAKPSQ